MNIHQQSFVALLMIFNMEAILVCVRSQLLTAEYSNIPTHNQIPGVFYMRTAMLLNYPKTHNFVAIPNTAASKIKWTSFRQDKQ